MSPASTPAVKSRLESWKSPSPTKEDIENRMDAANQLREMNLSAPVAKNNARFEKVNQNKVVLGETMKKALEEKRVEINGRLTAATKKVENMVKCKVEKVREGRAGAMTNSLHLTPFDYRFAPPAPPTGR
jgi:hypothetical protein